MGQGEPLEDGSLLDLARRAAAGEQQAMDDLVSRLYTPIRWKIRSILHEPYYASFVQDVAQEASIRVARHVTGFRGESDAEVRAWANRIARNEALRLLETNFLQCAALMVDLKPRELARTRLDRDDDQSDRATATKLQKEWGRALEEAYDALPSDTQELIHLRVTGARSWEEVGIRFGIAATAAKRRYQRALARLKREIEITLAQERV